jgi:hypothetical protein
MENFGKIKIFKIFDNFLKFGKIWKILETEKNDKD